MRLANSKEIDIPLNFPAAIYCADAKKNSFESYKLAQRNGFLYSSLLIEKKRARKDVKRARKEKKNFVSSAQSNIVQINLNLYYWYDPLYFIVIK